jgi:hypothetical protein
MNSLNSQQLVHAGYARMVHSRTDGFLQNLLEQLKQFRLHGVITTLVDNGLFHSIDVKCSGSIKQELLRQLQSATDPTQWKIQITPSGFTFQNKNLWDLFGEDEAPAQVDELEFDYH